MTCVWKRKTGIRDTEDINSCVMISVHCYRVGIQFTALIPSSVKRTFFITIRVILTRIICHYSPNPFFFSIYPISVKLKALRYLEQTITVDRFT
jgi:hypothetical protein